MPGRSYRLLEIVGTSANGVDEAITNGIADARQEGRQLNWFQVVEIRGHIQDDGVAHTQVTMKLGYRDV